MMFVTQSIRSQVVVALSDVKVYQQGALLVSHSIGFRGSETASIHRVTPRSQLTTRNDTDELLSGSLFDGVYVYYEIQDKEIDENRVR